MFDRILVPLDGSELAEQALEPAFGIAREFGSEVILLRVVTAEEHLARLPAMGPRPYDLRSSALHRTEEVAWAYLNGIKIEWGDLDVPVRTEVIPGTPAEMIGSEAELEAADLICDVHPRAVWRKPRDLWQRGRRGLAGSTHSSIASPDKIVKQGDVRFSVASAKLCHDRRLPISDCCV